MRLSVDGPCLATPSIGGIDKYVMVRFRHAPGNPWQEENSMVFTVWSQAFKNGEIVPTKFTRDGDDVSPAITWGDVPPGTKSFALICDDPDCPMGTWTHWIIYDIPGSQTGLPEGVPVKDVLEGGTKQGLNSWPRLGYGGPSPPPGRPHRYFFKLYALKDTLGLPPKADKKTLLKAMEGKILGQAEFHGTYARRR